QGTVVSIQQSVGTCFLIADHSLLIPGIGGPGTTRTSDLTLIRGALSPPELQALESTHPNTHSLRGEPQARTITNASVGSSAKKEKRRRRGPASGRVRSCDRGALMFPRDPIGCA